MHHIQKSIILSLAHTSPLRFTDLQPPKVPNNTFSYHLKKLTDGQYIEHTNQGYVATRKALKRIVFNTNTNKKPHNPDILTMICVQNVVGEVLLLNRNRKPFQGWYGFPGGLIHNGETLQEAARRELREKTGITPEGELKACGVLDFRYVDQDTKDIFLHVIGFVYSYKFMGNPLEIDDKATRYGQLTWSRLRRKNILPEVYEIKKIADSDEFTHVSISFEETTMMPVLTSDEELQVETASGPTTPSADIATA